MSETKPRRRRRRAAPVKEQKQYIVKIARRIAHRLQVPGETITLWNTHAQPLIEAGILVPVKD